ncbi:gem-associated protein 6-like [Tubulanus polymorphus]|uniref:gem-associated protein 6-like n=1 Tax=Tubulanus polymorphus TaxID=672921 RepID=UPI003DA1FB1C
MASDDSSNNRIQPHSIFIKDPEDWMQYLYKFVSVKTTGLTEHVGWVYTIDPVSETVCLVRFDDTGREIPSMDIVMGHAVNSIEIINAYAEQYRAKLDQLFKSKFDIPLTRAEISQRRDKVTDWLIKNRLPVKQDSSDTDVINVADVLFIEAPYTSEHCRSTNEIILGKIQGLLKNMPEDADSWI